MQLPFTTDQFLNVFREYNQSIFPLQLIFYFLAITIILFCFRQTKYSAKIVNSVLAFFWLWMGVAYHLVFFTSINKAAYVFGAAFIVQGMLFAYYGVIKRELTYQATASGIGLVGLVFVIFALVIYPVLGFMSGHVYPPSPTFGLPCPTTIFTFGILLWRDGKIPRAILIIPFLWALVGFTAAIKLGMTEDVSLLISAIITAVLTFFKRSHQKVVSA